MISRLRRRLAAVMAVGVAASTVPLMVVGPAPASAASPDIVISELYGGGGNAGAVYTNDFVELFNRGPAPVSIAGWTIQYASATGTGNFAASAPLAGSVPPGGRYLVQLAAGTTPTAALPTPDAVSAAPNMAGGAGKVIVARQSAGIGCNGSSNPCSPAQLGLIVDLVGYGNANFSETAPAPATTNATSSVRVNRCADGDDNSTEFATSSPANPISPENSAQPAAPCAAGDTAPTVAGVVPADGTSNVAVSASVAVTFSEPVAVADGGITLTCAGGAVAGTVTSPDDTTFTFDPSADLANEDTCTVTVSAGAVTDVDTDDPPDAMEADFTSTFTTAVADPCAATFTAIPAIQGSGAAAAITGVVRTKGVVVSDDEGPSPALRGFNLQDPTGDGDVATSDGIFVFNGANTDLVSNGDLVVVTGRATEFNGQTQIDQLQTVTVCGTGTVAPTDVELPFADATTAERYEGMLVRLPQTLTVTDTFTLARFGEVVVSSGGRLPQPTNIVAPGAPAIAQQQANDRNRLVIDDNRTDQNPDVVRNARGGQPLSASNTLRGGDTVTGAVGVMGYAFNLYRLSPYNALGGGAPDFQPANARPATAPAVGGRIQVAGMNVLNYFNTFEPGCTAGVGGAPIECRGAESQAEFDRQIPKTVAAIVGTGAEVIGVNEIENDGYGPNSAIAQLVGALNAATAPGTYAFIDPDAATGQINSMGSDAIKVAFIYKPGLVTPAGTTAVLNTVAFVNGGDSGPRSRPALAQAFTENSTGGVFTAVVNHLKSKGSACNAPDAGDGQGNCNQVRLNSVNRLIEWLATGPTGTGDTDYLLVGDLNSYAKEDPIARLQAAGYTNLVDQFVGADAYSYSFGAQWGYLDHALGSSSIVAQVTGVGEWHINSDEPIALDYNTNFKTPEQVLSFFAPDQYRTSDHDPAVVGLDLVGPTLYDVTGNGTITSPAGSSVANPSATGPATFDFKVRMTSRRVTTGSLTYTFPAAGLTIVGSDFTAPIVIGGTATTTGAAKVNGVKGSTLTLTALDGRPDRLRLVVRNGAGAVTYDSGNQILTSGTVVIKNRGVAQSSGSASSAV